MKILIYDYEQGLTLLEESESLFVLNFKTPTTEKEFDEIENKIPYEGYAYTLLKDNGTLYSSGIYSADSLYDDLIEAPKYNKQNN